MMSSFVFRHNDCLFDYCDKSKVLTYIYGNSIQHLFHETFTGYDKVKNTYPPVCLSTK